jgi:hypothetical protein
VTGGRDYSDAERVCDVLSEIRRDVLDCNRFEWASVMLMHGCAPGADKLAAQWAETYNWPQLRFPAHWNLHGAAAGPKRNQAMVDFGFDELVAFPGGAGTADMVRRTRAAGIRVTTILDQRGDV